MDIKFADTLQTQNRAYLAITDDKNITKVILVDHISAIEYGRYNVDIILNSGIILAYKNLFEVKDIQALIDWFMLREGLIKFDFTQK